MKPLSSHYVTDSVQQKQGFIVTQAIFVVNLSPLLFIVILFYHLRRDIESDHFLYPMQCNCIL